MMTTQRLLALLIEDSPTQAQMIAAQLSRYGIRSLIADDGPDGLRAADANHPDIVLLDINLPTMDGYQVCRRLKRDPSTASIPVIILTEYDGAEDMIRGLKAGADDYIPKDVFATDNLLAALRGFGLIQREM